MDDAKQVLELLSNPLVIIGLIVLTGYVVLRLSSRQMNSALESERMARNKFEKELRDARDKAQGEAADLKKELQDTQAKLARVSEQLANLQGEMQEALNDKDKHIDKLTEDCTRKDEIIGQKNKRITELEIERDKLEVKVIAYETALTLVGESRKEKATQETATEGKDEKPREA